ncbi:hypothetical protein IMSAGC020_01895 [Lachnospiraceae bacterium]|nr:hypothetical protein IMSAGC020_01895 [Lachnospiraceae bacterium]
MERKITIEEKVLYKEDYQVRMLKANDLEGILKMGGRGVNESSYYDYDVSGKISMKAMFERSKIKADDIKIFLRDLKIAVKEVETFLLNIHCILLKPEYIFYEEGRFFFCYYPLARQDMWEEFHVLTEYFVKQADYQEEECINMVFLLHKKTMDENYSLEKLTAECMQCDGKTEEIYEEPDEMAEEESQDAYELAKRDWITEREMNGNMMRETENLWLPVKRFLDRHKKPKWGDWDGLHIEEEEL